MASARGDVDRLSQSHAAALSEGLRVRRAEIEQAALTRVRTISDPTEVADPDYVQGLQEAVSAALNYGLDAVEASIERPPPIPPVLLVQARLAARSGVSLDTVLRRYLSGYTLLGDFLIGEAERSGLRGGALKQLLRTQAALFDRVLAAVSEEYGRESEARVETSESHRAKIVRRLIGGELLDVSSLPVDLAYDFGGFHLGVVASAPTARDAIRSVAASFDYRLLMVGCDENVVWAWFGSRLHREFEALDQSLPEGWPDDVALALGEPAEGLAGWRLTHRQARAAAPIALRGGKSIARYGDVALVASALQDDLLTTSLHRRYLVPLKRGPDKGKVACQTLRAYFAADRNVSSTAAALGVTRRTVNNRLHAIEERLGRQIGETAIELQVALRLSELTQFPA